MTKAHERISAEEAVRRLRALSTSDSEAAHVYADGVLLATVPDAVAEAWIAARARLGFWYS